MKHDDLDVGAMGYKIPWSTKKHLANMGERIHMQGSTCRRMQGNDLDNPTLTIIKTSHISHVLHRMLFDLNALGPLPQYVDQLQILRIHADGMNDGVRELSFRQVFAETLVGGVVVGEVQVVIADLEEHADDVDERDTIPESCVRSSGHQETFGR